MREKIKTLTAIDIVINTIIVIAVFVVLLAGYAAWKENDIKDRFDVECKAAGGIPLRSTYHYDPKDNTIHYVCLKDTSVMNIKGEMK